MVKTVYYYIYDSFLQEKKYDRVLAKIENRLANLEINGRITKMSKLKSIEDNLIEEIGQGVKNVVVVGDDVTILGVVNIIANYDIILGIIPLGYMLEIPKLLGIPSGESACDVLSSRKVETIDLGKVNNKYFISNLNINNNEIEIFCDDHYTIKPAINTCIRICNLYNNENYTNKSFFNPKDSFLDIFVENKYSFIDKIFKKKNICREGSIFPIKKAIVKTHKSISIMMDPKNILKTPLEITVNPKKLKVIVGKGRVF